MIFNTSSWAKETTVWEANLIPTFQTSPSSQVPPKSILGGQEEVWVNEMKHNRRKKTLLLEGKIESWESEELETGDVVMRWMIDENKKNQRIDCFCCF